MQLNLSPEDACRGTSHRFGNRAPPAVMAAEITCEPRPGLRRDANVSRMPPASRHPSPV